MNKRIRIASLVAALGLASLTVDSAFSGEAPQSHTLQDLKAAMQSEAHSFLRYTAFAQHARKEGKAALAEVLEKTAEAE